MLCKCAVFARVGVLINVLYFRGSVYCVNVLCQRVSVLCKLNVLCFRGSVYCVNVLCFRGSVYCVNMLCVRGSVCCVNQMCCVLEGQCTV